MDKVTQKKKERKKRTHQLIGYCFVPRLPLSVSTCSFGGQRSGSVVFYEVLEGFTGLTLISGRWQCIDCLGLAGISRDFHGFFGFFVFTCFRYWKTSESIHHQNGEAKSSPTFDRIVSFAFKREKKGQSWDEEKKNHPKIDCD